MAARRLDKTEWHAFFDRISNALVGKSAVIETASLKLGDQVEAEKRYRDWQREVESTLREVRGELDNGDRNDAHRNGNGDGA